MTNNSTMTAAEMWRKVRNDSKALALQLEQCKEIYLAREIDTGDLDGPEWELIDILFSEIADCLSMNLKAIEHFTVYAAQIEKKNG